MFIYSINPHHFFSIRSGETKIGEKIQSIRDIENWDAEIEKSSAKFILIGVPEDIGVRANYGRAGAHSAFKAALKSFLSMQNNHFLNAENSLLLGEINTHDLMKQSEKYNTKTSYDIQQLRLLVEELDKRVSTVLRKIFQLKKIPIIIGGGHNNSFPIIQSAFKAFNEKINVLNCDAHSDLRAIEGRHSGNSFSYAFENKYLHHYHILGLHEQYTSENIFKYISENSVTYYTYEDIFIRKKITFQEALNNSIELMKGRWCGLELDLDAITNVPSSARTSSGISPIEARKFIFSCSNKLNCVYLHLAEGAPETAHIRADYKTGKLLAYLICDFIKGTTEK